MMEIAWYEGNESVPNDSLDAATGAAGIMNHANLKTSKRLQRLHKVLSDGKEHSGMDIIKAAHIYAVSAAVSELRANGCNIVCRQSRNEMVCRAFYQMVPP